MNDVNFKNIKLAILFLYYKIYKKISRNINQLKL